MSEIDHGPFDVEFRVSRMVRNQPGELLQGLHDVPTP
jgi:hypothetical protein